MRDALPFMQAVMETETFSSACAILVLVFPVEWSSNFSRHSFPQKRRGLEWGSPFLAASSRRTAEPSQEKIVTKAARVSPFIYRARRRTTPRPPSYGSGEQAKPQKNNGNSELKFETATCPSAYVKKAWQDSCCQWSRGMRLRSHSAASIRVP